MQILLFDLPHLPVQHLTCLPPVAAHLLKCQVPQQPLKVPHQPSSFSTSRCPSRGLPSPSCGRPAFTGIGSPLSDELPVTVSYFPLCVDRQECRFHSSQWPGPAWGAPCTWRSIQLGHHQNFPLVRRTVRAEGRRRRHGTEK